MQPVIEAESLFTILSIVLGGIAIGVSIFAVGLSLYFHRQSTQLYNSLSKIASEIEASTKLTEITSKNLIDPIVRAILDVVQGQAQTSIDHMRPNITRTAAGMVERVLKETPERERREAREAFIKEVESLLSTLKQRIGVAEYPLTKEGIMPGAPAAPAPTERAPIAGSPLYNWMPFVRRIKDLEAHNKFLSVRMLREKAFADEPETRESLQIAIDRKMLLTYFVDNPKNPRFPTLACKLNLQHTVVREILLAIGGVPSGHG